MMSIGALRAAAERNVSVRRNCSIIGFDDIELGRLTFPSLSTVGQSVRALGDMAAQTLNERIAAAAGANSVRSPPRRRVVSPRLIVRESTAAGPARDSGIWRSEQTVTAVAQARRHNACTQV